MEWSTSHCLRYPLTRFQIGFGRRRSIDCLILASELVIGLGMRLERSLRDAADVLGGWMEREGCEKCETFWRLFECTIENCLLRISMCGRTDWRLDVLNTCSHYIRRKESWFTTLLVPGSRSKTPWIKWLSSAAGERIFGGVCGCPYSHNRNFGPKLLFPRPPSFFRQKPIKP